MSKPHKLKHLAIIMDGNRRWAHQHKLPTMQGHQKGYQKMKQVAKWCVEANIKVLTVYAFSTENWNRSPSEVRYLMQLLQQAFSNDALAELQKNKVRVRVIGQRQRLNKKLQTLINDAEEKTARSNKLLFNIALSYGGRQEIVAAVKKIATQKTDPKSITEKTIANNLWTAGIPDPDIIVRTSGEQRLSNFLSWQSAYSELMFINKHWPEFSKSDLKLIVAEFERRQRRFGK